MQTSNSKKRSDLFFYCQKETSTHRKRVKKVLDEATLSNLFKKFNNKFPTSINADNIEPERTLSDRLGDLITTSKSRISSTSSNRRSSVTTEKRKQSTKDEPPQNPNAFTDTRLQGLRFLTDDSIKELERFLIDCVKYDLTPILPADIVHSWHLNWADLTMKVSYKNFPIWRTKTAYEAMVKQKKTEKNGSVLGDSERRSSLTSSRKSKNSKPGHISTLSRLTSISERKTATQTNNNKNNNNNNDSSSSSVNLEASINRRQGSASQKSLTHISESPIAPLNIREKTRNEMDSRLTQTTNIQLGSNLGCLVNYQLSNFKFREKGWTVISPSLEDSLKDNQKKAVKSLKDSLKSIQDCHNFNDKFGINLPCRYKLYGSQRRDQLEKYKVTTIRKKKSHFALSILRNEIPKPLDLNQIIHNIINPQLKGVGLTLPPRIISDRPTKSASSIRSNLMPCEKDELLVKQNILTENQQSSTVFNTQTNDGTNCVYYPNGQLAILSANTFGFYVDNVPVGLSANVNNLGQSINSNLQETQSNTRAHNTEKGLCFQNIKDSYTTIVFSSNETNKMHDLKSPISKSDRKQNILNYFEKSNMVENLVKNSNSSERKVLALITASGACVCYRSNGMPYFVCTEVGGYLCNVFGCIKHQWKWNELHLNQYEELFTNLNIQLNEFIQIEYKSPFNIKLKFDCNKEVINFNLGCVKENQLKLNELLNRTVSDLPMKSALGNFKLIPTAKGSIVSSYKQQHNQNRKQSISFNNTATGQRDARIEKLLEPTVSYKDIPLMKDLYAGQKKIRALLEEWQNHCRKSLNILSPNLYIFPETLIEKESRLNINHRDFDKIILYKRKSKSVLEYTPKSVVCSSFKPENRNQTSVKSDADHRSRSAIAELLIKKVNRTKKLTKQHIDLIDRIKQFKLQMSKVNGIERSNDFKYSMTKNNDTERKVTQEEALSALLKSLDSVGMIANTNKFLELKPVPACLKIPSFYRQRTFPAITDVSCNNSIKSKRPQFSNSTELLTKASSLLDFKDITDKSPNPFYYTNEHLSMCCPVLLHNRLAFNKNEIDCKCRKQKMPQINDVEYDTLLKLLPPDQLAVIVITDSKYTTTIESIINEIYCKYNKNRTQPCKESIKDDTRFFHYNITAAFIDSNHNQPLLVTRHNVSPGMVLIYKNSGLVFCDALFNGYGYSEQDFHKQLTKSRNDARASKFLPQNFRFSSISENITFSPLMYAKSTRSLNFCNRIQVEP